jgi:hypothetical protein
MRKLERKIGGKWSLKYKKSINCKQPKETTLQVWKK